MKLSKTTWTVIIIIAVIIIVIALIVYKFRCDIFSGLSSCVQDPNKTNTPVPAGSPSPTWVSETFPLNIGMYGAKIKALQTALNITADGKFGPQTKGAVIAKGYTVPLSESDYNKIVIPSSGGGNNTGKKTLDDYIGTYINTGNTINTTVRYIADSSVFKTYGKNANVGRLGTALPNGYHEMFDVAGDDSTHGLKLADSQLKVILNIK